MTHPLDRGPHAETRLGRGLTAHAGPLCRAVAAHVHGGVAILELHGGLLEVTSEPGRGTTMTVQLPLKSVPAPSPELAVR